MINTKMEQKIQEFRFHLRKAREAATELIDEIVKAHGVDDLEEISEHLENAAMEINAALTEAEDEGMKPLEDFLKHGVDEDGDED